MKQLILGVALAGLVLSLGVGEAKSAASRVRFATKVFWSESYAEQMVLRNVRVPCRNVFEPHGADWWGPAPKCDVNSALRAVAAAKREAAKATKNPNSCGVYDPTGMKCKTQAQLGLDNAEEVLSYARDGLKLNTADCNGTGSPDASGYRFATFTCKVLVVIHPPEGCGGNGCVDTNVRGRIAVWPTGNASLQWKLI